MKDVVQNMLPAFFRSIKVMKNTESLRNRLRREAESKELKSLLIRVKEESEIASLRLNIKRTKIMASGPITVGQRKGEKVEGVTFPLLGLQNHCGR